MVYLSRSSGRGVCDAKRGKALRYSGRLFAIGVGERQKEWRSELVSAEASRRGRLESVQSCCK